MTGRRGRRFLADLSSRAPCRRPTARMAQLAPRAHLRKEGKPSRCAVAHCAGNRADTAARCGEPRFDMLESMTGPDLDRPLRAALPLLRKATGVDAAMAGPVTLGGRRLLVTRVDGMLTSTMLGLVATPGVGAGGRVLQLARPFAVDDYLHSKTVSHHFDRKIQ